MNASITDSRRDEVPETTSDKDFVVVVGPENVKMSVHSQILGHASMAFGAMLCRYWNEGQKNGSTPTFIRQ
jgi:hypothetical protein